MVQTVKKLTSALGALRNVRSLPCVLRNPRQQAPQVKSTELLNELNDDHVAYTQAPTDATTFRQPPTKRQALQRVTRRENLAATSTSHTLTGCTRANSCPSHQPKSPTAQTLERDERRWREFITLRERFEREVDGLDPWISDGIKYVRLEQVPFPETELMNAKDGDALTEAVLRMLLRRWHPDKWAQRFGSRLRPCERVKILDGVNETVSKLNRMLSDVRGVCFRVTNQSIHSAA